MSRRRLWIRKAIKKPGSLRAYVKRMYGRRGFVKGKRGRLKIRHSILQRLAKKKGIIGFKARLALTLRGFGKVARKRKRKRRSRRRKRRR